MRIFQSSFDPRVDLRAGVELRGMSMPTASTWEAALICEVALIGRTIVLLKRLPKLGNKAPYRECLRRFAIGRPQKMSEQNQ